MSEAEVADDDVVEEDEDNEVAELCETDPADADVVDTAPLPLTAETPEGVAEELMPTVM